MLNILPIWLNNAMVQDFRTSSPRAGRYVRQLTGYSAFIPAPLPPDPPRGLAEHPAQVDEVLLRRGPLGSRAALPLRHELSRCRQPALPPRVLPVA